MQSSCNASTTMEALTTTAAKTLIGSVRGAGKIELSEADNARGASSKISKNLSLILMRDRSNPLSERGCQ